MFLDGLILDRLEITDELKNSYEFKLILRGTRDGFTPKKFHEICDNKLHTVSIIKIKDSNEILGGYNPIEWRSGHGWGNTKDSFIFSFKNDDNIEDYILSRIKNEEYAINCNDHFGPSFGMGDLRIYRVSDKSSNNCTSYCKKVYYEKSIRETEDKFSIEEYEIFQIKKNCKD